MKLGFLEKFYLTGPWRNWQRQWELQQFQALHPFAHSNTVLEIGCGDGRGLVYLHQLCQPQQLIGLDLDANMLNRTQRTLNKQHIKATLIESSATQIALEDNSVDLVMSFGCVHHIPNWQVALTELKRVLKPGGYFYAEEFYRPLLEAPLFKQLVPHPPQRFSHQEFITELNNQGLNVVRDKNIAGLAGFLVAKST